MTNPSGDINGRQHFNRWSATYERSFMQWLLFDRVHQGVLARVPASFTPAEVLDIGCGTGRLLRRMQARWPAACLRGVDPAEGMVAQARAQMPGVQIDQAPAESLPLEAGSVDLVTSTTSFHHWTDQAQGVREAARVLRRGGLFVLADMALPWAGRPLSPHQVRAMFEAAGLAIRSQTSPVLFFTFTVGEKPDRNRL
jgi:ubiquinone/menaquinone biosynthesis C-methylase UbiE